MLGRARRALAALSVALLIGGCAGQQLRTRVKDTTGVIDVARGQGAQRCAPVELAMAESHRDFARQDLDEGNYVEARRHVVIAEHNAAEAVRKSPKDFCNPGPAVVVTPGPGDADGDGLLDNVDECPRVPEDFDQFQDQDGCPETDNDADGIVDKIDQCPNDPEDRDGFQDDDGCPDLDNDNDGLVDKLDQCPDEAEDKDGVDDDDGCPDCDDDKDGFPECPAPAATDKCPGEAGVAPDGCAKKYTMIVVTETKIELQQTIYFDTKKATIKPVSFPLLDEVAQAMRDYPTIAVRIEGHTDSRGSDKFNLKLSDQRAASVRAYLVGKGIDGARMAAKGYGEGMPVADNRTTAGRDQNRRVDFVITGR